MATSCCLHAGEPSPWKLHWKYKDMYKQLKQSKQTDEVWKVELSFFDESIDIGGAKPEIDAKSNHPI